MPSTVSELTTLVLQLPPQDRIALALRVWESVGESDRADMPSPDLLVELDRRNAEMESDPAIGRTHAAVMAAARRAIE